jgi:ribosomal-protein-serine acetyltransferase
MGESTRPPDTIRDGEVLLRRWQPTDAPLLIDAIRASMAELRPWMFWAVNFTDQVAVDFVAGSKGMWERGEAFKYGLFDEAGTVLGSFNLMARVGPGALELGYWLRTSHTGRGLATRALSRLMAAGLALPGIDAIEIHVNEANTASARIAQRLGFVLVERRNTRIVAPGQVGVTLIWRRAALAAAAADQDTAAGG